MNSSDCKQKSCPLGRSAVHLVSRVRSLGFHSVFRSFVFAGRRSVDHLIVNSVMLHSAIRSLARMFVLSLGLPLARLFAFLVCSVVPPFAQFFLLSMGINML